MLLSVYKYIDCLFWFLCSFRNIFLTTKKTSSSGHSYSINSKEQMISLNCYFKLCINNICAVIVTYIYTSRKYFLKINKIDSTNKCVIIEYGILCMSINSNYCSSNAVDIVALNLLLQLLSNSHIIVMLVEKHYSL